MKPEEEFKLKFLENAKLGDETSGAIPFEADGTLQLRRLIEPGKATLGMTGTPDFANDKVTILDQTWRDADVLHGIATVAINITT